MSFEDRDWLKKPPEDAKKKAEVARKTAAQVAHAHFTPREWAIITEALTFRKNLTAGYYKVDGVYVTENEIDRAFMKFPSVY